MRRLSRPFLVFVLIAGWYCLPAVAQELSSRPEPPSPAPVQMPPNSDPVYQQLRKVGMGEAVVANNLVLKRAGATFTLSSGTVCFLTPVAGRVTGAVFVGNGTLTLDPPIEIERRTIALLTKNAPFNEEFNELTLRFSDGTFEELKKAAGGGASAATCSSGLPQDAQETFRKKLHTNISARLLQDVLSPEPGGLFVALVHGKRFSSKLVFVVDAHGAMQAVAPEEVALFTYDEMKSGLWASYHLPGEYASGQATGSQQNHIIKIEHQKLDTQIERSGKLNGDATTTFVAQYNGVRVVPFDLFPTLRVQTVSDDGGHSLAFIQEDKNEDPDCAVILPRALAKGEHFTVRTLYSGKDAVRNEGSGNYFPVARSDWYPNTSFGQYATYDLSFRIPKGMSMVATGTLLRDVNEGNENLTTWKSEVPQAVAGFNFGMFKRQEATLQKSNYLIQSYANADPPNSVAAIQSEVSGTRPGQGEAMAALGTMSTTSMMKKPLAEAQVAVEMYTDYFGPAPYKRLAMTQQTACNFGQAWPALVWLPICSYFDTTVQHQLGLDDPRGYWKVVAPHEVAHQWWGHTVGFNSYRDQWMSEGFAEMSASLYLQRVFGPKDFIKFWNDERDLLTERNKEGVRAIDAGPVTLGYRLANTRSGYDIPRRLIYPKGGYILHMVRMMMWNPKTGDELFKEAMQDFVKSYANRAATTEDFKSTLERHMNATMDAAGNQRMDWFFNQYVYGTALPAYKFDYKLEKSGADTLLRFSVTQSNVDAGFRMPVPLYLELADGRVIRVGSMLLVGNTTESAEAPLGTLKDPPKRAMINYYDDVLSTEK